MTVKLADYRIDDTTEMRAAYCETLMDLAAEDSRIVELDADLRGAAGMNAFAEKFPDRAFNVGVQEANMMGVAAGLSATGYIPFANTFAPFATRRACDQIFMSCAYAKQNVKVVGLDPGVTAALNGGTHMPFEDIAIMRAFPEVTVVEPADSMATRDVIKLAKENDGVWYIRLGRKTFPAVYQESPKIEYGKVITVREGTDVTLIASGIMVAEALKAADELEKENISARVLDSLFIKPLDEEAISKAIDETGALVTCENHNVINGLGSAVADFLATEKYAPLEKVGVQDEFGEVGPVDYLKERFDLTADVIVQKAKKAIARKNS
ncbi:MAG: transketolase family protein [Clostridiaceae bacterium]|nr:transketolase family protein [Clostridiaceae bacterium]